MEVAATDSVPPALQRLEELNIGVDSTSFSVGWNRTYGRNPTSNVPSRDYRRAVCEEWRNPRGMSNQARRVSWYREVLVGQSRFLT